MSRVVWASVALALLVAVLLGAWFVSGWHDVRLRQAELQAAPVRAASTRADELGGELRAELAGLIAREGRRPYFHYQNLMHDPLASPGQSVTPSPLARGPEDPRVLGYFLIDAKGRTTTPTVNDEVPALSEPEHLAANKAFRDTVARDLARELRPAPAVAQATQAMSYDASSYAQNTNATAVWANQPFSSELADARVTVLVSPLEWRTLVLGGMPALVASRTVQTPDGTLVQGFVVDRATLTGWLAGKAGDMVAELRGAAPGVEVAPGWHLSVAPNPRTLAQAATEARALRRDFLVRFIVVGAIAILVAAFVLVLVRRAEMLARERSQFAAAAAHELRTPLAGLQLYGDMLADGLGDHAKVTDYARRMSEEAARLGRVVSNVLGFTQLERGNLSVHPALGGLGEALCEIADRVQPALDRAGAVLDVEVDRELRASFDRDALARIVGNLLDNAEKYTRGAEDRTIRIAARESGEHVEVVVGDRGSGIAEPAALFRPFARGVATDGPAGLGLGLALSQSLARAMGGSLVYRSRDGGGAELVLTLPRA